MPRQSKEALLKKAQMEMKKGEELSNSRLLDVHKISHYPQVKALIQKLYDEMVAAGRVDPEKADSVKKHLKAIVLDLFDAHILDEKMYIAYSRDKNGYGPGTRMHQLFFKYKMVIAVVDFLIDHEYVEHHKGFKAKDGTGKLSRMKAKQKLLELLKAEGVVPGMGESMPDDDETKLVILRGPKKKGKQTLELEYEDTPETIRMKESLKLINENLKKHAILIYLKDSTLKVLSRKMNRNPERGPLNFAKKNLHRVFNNGSWQQGGRFYGGWWQGVPRIFREFIRINDKDVVEPDFKGMHINMLYAWEKLPMPEGDVYQVPGYPNDDKFRDFMKQLLLILLNAEDRKKARAAIHDEVVHKKKLKLPSAIKSTAGKDIFPLLDAFGKKHQPISHYFCTGKGIDLQYYDSLIAEKVMLTFSKIGYPILPLHDSFIIHHGFEQELMDAMNQAFKDLFYVHSKVDLKYNSLSNRQRRQGKKRIPDNSKMDLEQILELKKQYSTYYRLLEQHRNKDLPEGQDNKEV